MKIAIDSGPIAKTSSRYGIGTYVRELSQRLKNVQVLDFSDNFSGISKEFDILHFTKFRPFFISISFFKPKNSKFVLTIYDLIPLIYPKHYPPGIKGKINWIINKFLVQKNVDAIITISETSKKDICRFLGIDPKKVFVTYLAAPEIYKKNTNKKELSKIRIKYRLPDHFVLCDADIYFSKNIPNLVKACKIANLPLVLVGGGKKTIEYAKSINFDHPELLHLKDVDWSNTSFLSQVEIKDLVKIYNLADVYVQPSFYEGFGIPLIQAIQCGVPCVVARNQCLVEILDDNLNFVDPNDPKAIAYGILHPNVNIKLHKLYSWERTVQKTIEVYESLSH